MCKNKIIFFALILSCCLILNNAYAAGQCRISSKAYCAADALEAAFKRLNVKHGLAKSVLLELTTSAARKKGINSLLEIKQAAIKAGLDAVAIKADYKDIAGLLNKGQLIANITGNRHFCLIKGVSGREISVYIPGLNEENPLLPQEEFLNTWDNRVILLVCNKPVDLGAQFKEVADSELENILGGQSCSNSSGKRIHCSGSRGVVIYSSGNAAGRKKDVSTKEPVTIRNGNLFLEVSDIAIPTRSAPCELRRYYNSEVVSEVAGWTPEPGAGSWAIESGEYSGQGNRMLSDLAFQNLTLDLDLRTIQPGANAWETAWINIRFTEDPNDPRKAKDCYYFLIHKNGNVELSKWKNGVQYFLVNYYAALNCKNKNHIRIVAIDANIMVYVNGALKINYSDPNPVLGAGKVALESYFSHAHFDNVQIASGGNTYAYDFSTDDNDFFFGYGWTASFFQRLKEYPTHVTYFDENNSKLFYLPQEGGVYLPLPFTDYSRLTKDASGFTLRSKYGLIKRFDLNGRLQYIEDPNGNRTSISYGTVNGRLVPVAIVEPAGRSIALQYGANAMVSKAVDPAGNYLQYFYDSNRHLTKVIDRQGNTTLYAYDGTTHNLKQITDPSGKLFKYFYTYNDRVQYQTDPLGQKTTFDYLWTTVHVINKKGEIYKYNFDGNEFLQSVTDPSNVMERWANDANGNITGHYDKLNHYTGFNYDANGNLLQFTDALGNRTVLTYDPNFNQMTSVLNPRGALTSFTYDSRGNLLQTVSAEGQVTLYSYNPFGQVESLTGPRGEINRYSYDAYGNLASKTDPAGNVFFYSYDILGRLLSVTDPQGAVTRYAYDKNGNLTSSTDALGNVTAYTYNKNGQTATAKDPLGNVVSFSYDCFGNLTKSTDPLGYAVTYAYDTANQMHLDRANLLSVVDPAGRKTLNAYDSLGRLIRITDPAGGVTSFTYDSQGNCTARTDAKGIKTAYVYDNINRLVRVNYIDSTNVIFSFDASGNLIQAQDASGISSFSYDRVNRLKSRVYPDGTALSYNYDSGNNRLTMDLSGYGRINYDYDSLGRLVRLARPDGKAAQFFYDRISRRVQLIYPNGASAVYGYDAAGRLVQLVNKDGSGRDISRFSYTYDKSSRRARIDSIDGYSAFTYDKASRILKEEGALSLSPFSRSYAYDTSGNIKTFFKNTYTYNSFGQLTQGKVYNDGKVGVTGYVSSQREVRVKVNGVPAATGMGKFAAGDIALFPGTNTIRAEAVDALGYKATHQVKVSYSPASVPLTCSYDKNGNLIQRKFGSGVENYEYDLENRLRRYSGPGQSGFYGYDYKGDRVYREVNGRISRYYYDGEDLVAEKSGSGSGSVYYLQGPGIDELLSDSAGNCYLSDGLGSVVNVTDAGGVSVVSYDYKAYGGISRQIGASSNNWLFTGRQYDPESGLYYYRNRYYDPRIGRFITKDPIGSVNRYAYCDNNPVNGIDPMGLYTLIVHGLGEHSEGYSGELGKKLRSSGETTNEIFWSGNILDIAAFSRVANEIKGAADFAAARGEQLNVIGHSWGGVLVSSALRTTKSKANLATLGTPYFNLSRPVGVRRYVNFIGEGDIIGLMSIFNVSAMQFGVINGRTDIANIHNYWNNEEVINIILEMSNADRGRRDGKSATK